MKIILLLLVLPALCRSGSTQLSGDLVEPSRAVTGRPPYASSTYGGQETSYQHYTTEDENSTTSGQLCKTLVVSPVHPYVHSGESLSINCTCWRNHIKHEECPEWEPVYDTQHTYTRTVTQNYCTVTLNIEKMNRELSTRLSCTDSQRQRRTRPHTRLVSSEYGGRCESDSDCAHPFTCLKNGTCDCPTSTPVYISQATGKCYPVKKLLSTCSYSVQCKSVDRNSYCLRSDVNNTGPQYCLCGPGYEMSNDQKCVCDDCGLKYIYSISKRYQTVFYVLISVSILLILIGLFRLCLLHRRGPSRRPGVVISPRTEDSSPLTDVEKPKEKF